MKEEHASRLSVIGWIVSLLLFSLLVLSSWGPFEHLNGLARLHRHHAHFGQTYRHR
jgi:hypothetical protein